MNNSIKAVLISIGTLLFIFGWWGFIQGNLGWETEDYRFDRVMSLLGIVAGSLLIGAVIRQGSLTRIIELKGILRPFFDVFAAIIVGLIVGAAVMDLFKFDPWLAYSSLLKGAFGDKYGWADTAFNATPLILTGLTFAIGVRAGLFNIGAQGQMMLGAIAAVGIGSIAMPPGIHHMVTIMVAMMVGALWSLPAAFLKAKRGVHEVISTIMLNFVALWLVRFLALKVFGDPNRAEKTVSVLESTQFSTIISGADVTHVVWISILAALLVYVVLWHMPLGYALRSTGLNVDATRYGGMNPNRAMNSAFVLGGMAAGLAGATQIIGRPPVFALYGDLSQIANLGFDGIAVALLGRNHPIGAIFGALFFGALNAGLPLMQIQAKVPLEMVRVIQGVIVIVVSMPELWRLLNIKSHALKLKTAFEKPQKA